MIIQKSRREIILDKHSSSIVIPFEQRDRSFIIKTEKIPEDSELNITLIGKGKFSQQTYTPKDFDKIFSVDPYRFLRIQHTTAVDGDGIIAVCIDSE